MDVQLRNYLSDVETAKLEEKSAKFEKRREREIT
jgi:hypothetical protein